MNLTSSQAAESLTRWASKVPAFQIESSDPASAATGVPVNKIINLVMSLGIDSSTVNNTNVTLSPSVARTTSLQLDGRTIRISPSSNLAAITTYTVTVTNSVRGLYGSSYVPGVQRTTSFTTA